ncbi:rab proteins geranylgeranyltransferase component A 1 [Tamandua tetradactyla]|uniref:rab proteins geranylgeranyltransferase component A 1 n=1 Tax=Tamandua tetradactyla TaxID=48850 RepID=UPI00405465B7
MADSLPSEFDVIVIGSGMCGPGYAPAMYRKSISFLPSLKVERVHGPRIEPGSPAWKENSEFVDESSEWQEHVLENEEAIVLSRKDKTIQHVEMFCYTRMCAKPGGICNLHHSVHAL